MPDECVFPQCLIPCSRVRYQDVDVSEPGLTDSGIHSMARSWPTTCSTLGGIALGTAMRSPILKDGTIRHDSPVIYLTFVIPAKKFVHKPSQTPSQITSAAIFIFASVIVTAVTRRIHGIPK